MTFERESEESSLTWWKKKNGVVERNWKRPSLLNWCLFDLVGSNPTRITNKVGAYSKNKHCIL